MKLQGFSIIFGLLMLPIILVLSYYLQLQVKTITLQSAYDSKLLDATYDAVQAFEINTANEDLSSVADSLRSIIEASNNVFFNTLATNMGLSNASKSRMQVFVPAVLYTLYDGYYIYSPTEVPEVLADTNGQAVVVDEEEDDGDDSTPSVLSTPGLRFNGTYYEYDPNSDAQQTITLTTPPPEDYGSILYRLCSSATKNPVDLYTTDINYNANGYEVYYKIDYVLKSYMPYAAKYFTRDPALGDIDVTISYTLDNYLTVEGNIGSIYYTKSGYYINSDSVTVSTEPGYIKIDSYNQNEANELIEAMKALKTDDDPGNNDDLGNIKISVTVPGVTNPIEIDTNAIYMDTTSSFYDDASQPQNKKKVDQWYSILEYYVEAKIFSDWVNTNLKEVKGSNIVENTSASLIATEPGGVTPLDTQTTSEYIYPFIERDEDGNLEDGYNVFNAGVDPENDVSFFQSHKRKVMRNMIQYNLNLAMSVYSASTTAAYTYQMPVLTESDWETITSRLTVVSFMQGLKCGLKVYNGYACAYSTNNELTVIPEEIYYLKYSCYDIGHRLVNDWVDIHPSELYYHRADCPDFIEGPSIDPAQSGTYLSVPLVNLYDIISFTSKEVKYDKVYDKYENIYNYDHRNLACYRCIIDSNYKRIWDGMAHSTDPAVVNYYNQKMEFANAVRAMGVAKERNEIYKSYNINVDEGYEIVYDKNASLSKTSSRPQREIKRVEVVFDIVRTDMLTDRTVYFELQGSDIIVQNGKNVFSLNTNQAKEQSISIPVEPANDSSLPIGVTAVSGHMHVTNDMVDFDINNLNNAILYVKVVYK